MNVFLVSHLQMDPVIIFSSLLLGRVSVSNYPAPNNANDNLNQFNLMQSKPDTPHNHPISISHYIRNTAGDGSLYNVGQELAASSPWYLWHNGDIS